MTQRVLTPTPRTAVGFAVARAVLIAGNKEAPMRYARPNTPGAKVTYQRRYDNFIGGTYVKPKLERYFENISPVTGQVFCEVARSSAEDIELALDAAHGAKVAWGKTSVADRSAALLKLADLMEANLEMLAVSETWGQRQAGPRDPGRRPALGDRSLPLLRGVPARRGGLDGRARRQHRQLPPEGAARRRRADHPVELPAAHGGVEAGPGPGRRQLRRAQARRADPGDDPAVRRAGRQGLAARRAQRRQRLRHRGRQAAGVETAASARWRSPARPPPAA
jgi:hypothetical protein